MAKVGRPIFRRGLEYVAVRPIKMTSKHTVKPGEPVNLPIHRLRSFYQRRRIGPKGHPWTEQSLKNNGFPLAYVTDKVAPVEPDKPPKFEDQLPITTPEKTVITEDDLRRFVVTVSADFAYDDLSDDQKQQVLGRLIETIEPPEPVKLGSQWGYPDVTDEKFRSKKKAKAWYLEQKSAGGVINGGT